MPEVLLAHEESHVPALQQPPLHGWLEEQDVVHVPLAVSQA
jgi:hypothetical protein